MNVVYLMTDTQNKEMVGCYGWPGADTPNLDRLAGEGVRFERAYTTCPLCTPARGAIFSGLHPQINGAWTNNIAPSRAVPLMGEIFRHSGYRAGYTGKWHLDGSAYFGDGVPGGGFEEDWWYDGKRYSQDIGPEMFKAYRSCSSADQLREAGFDEDTMWGHRVADRAVDFLERVSEQPFVLAVSFDEPHGPCVAPPEYWEKFRPEDIPLRPNHNAPLDAKPELHRVQRDTRGEVDLDSWRKRQCRFFGCNSYIDREIGRVVDAVDRLHGDDTLVIYTSDHGDQRLAHGLSGKGTMMYEETCNVPLLVRGPGVAKGAVSDALVSHVDILPTMLAAAGLERPPSLHGTSLLPVLADPSAAVREHAMIGFHRFAINHDSNGEFYPIRCATDGRHKLVINLFETDELYDLGEDPYELTNRVADPALAGARDRLHDWLLDEMDRIRDPFRSFRWGDRPWRSVRAATYRGPNRSRPRGFAFEPRSVGE
jgi:uncharacterized sulfatase